MHSTAVLETTATSDELVGKIDDALFELAAGGMPPFRYIESVLQSPEVDVHIWQGGYSDDQVRIVEDAIIGCVYAVFQSESSELVKNLSASLRTKIEYRTCSAIQKNIDSMILSNPDSIIQLSLCGNKDYDAVTEQLLNGLSRHKDVAVRSSAVQTMGMLGWPTLAQTLRNLREIEKDPNILNVIEYGLSQYSSTPEG